MAYRPPTDGFHPCLRCGADVADGAQFCPVCGAPQNVAPVVSRRRGGTPWWVPAGIIAGAIAALGAGVLLAVLLGGDPDSVADDPSPTATTSIAASASTNPSGSVAPTASVEPTPELAPIIPNLGIAAVVTDALNLRSQPNETGSVVAELAPDQRLFVIGAPSEGADDLNWYRVAALAGPSCPEPCEMIGYVATPIEAGDPWIEAVGVDCPTSPMTHDDLSALLPLEALHCFGNNTIVVTGTVEQPEGVGYEGPFAYSPAWLAPPLAIPFLATASGHVIGFRADPETDLGPPADGDVVRVTGHYEDPAATSCRVTLDPAFADEEPQPSPPAPALAVLTCRSSFVWADYEVIGP